MRAFILASLQPVWIVLIFFCTFAMQDKISSTLHNAHFSAKVGFKDLERLTGASPAASFGHCPDLSCRDLSSFSQLFMQDKSNGDYTRKQSTGIVQIGSLYELQITHYQHILKLLDQLDGLMLRHDHALHELSLLISLRASAKALGQSTGLSHYLSPTLAVPEPPPND